jgi:hypothetical protein
MTPAVDDNKRIFLEKMENVKVSNGKLDAKMSKICQEERRELRVETTFEACEGVKREVDYAASLT